MQCATNDFCLEPVQRSSSPGPLFLTLALRRSGKALPHYRSFVWLPAPESSALTFIFLFPVLRKSPHFQHFSEWQCHLFRKGHKARGAAAAACWFMWLTVVGMEKQLLALCWLMCLLHPTGTLAASVTSPTVIGIE